MRTGERENIRKPYKSVRIYAKLVNSASAPLPVCQRNGIMRSGNCFDRGG